MRKVYFYQTVCLALLFSASACGAPTAATSTPTTAPTLAPTEIAPTIAVTEVVVAATVEPTVEATAIPTAIVQEEVTALPFMPTTFTDSSAGFALDYPADWTLDPSSQVGVRGSQALLLSPDTTSESIPDGGTRISIITNVWDPKHDIDAYVAQRKTAWAASGFAIEREEQWQLADGRVVYLILTHNPSPVLNLLTTVGEDYLQITAEGDLVLAETIFRTLRPTE